MNLPETLEKINKDRERIECCFVFALWNDPDSYGDYLYVNENSDKTIQSSDGKFFFLLGRELYKAGYRNFDNVTIDNFIHDKHKIKEKFEKYGGYKEVDELKKIVHSDNLEAYFDELSKINSLQIIATKYDEMFSNVERFDNCSSEDVYGAFELLNNSVALNTSSNITVESLVVDDKYLSDLNAGETTGLNYGKNCPLMNYITLGAPLGDLFMFAGHSGCGKSSFIFNNMVLPFSQQNINVCIISNEMRSTVYKQLLLVHILTTELNYWKITRKKLKTGNFSDEEMDMLKAAARITEERYSNIKFVKLDSDNISTVFKVVKKMAHMGTTSFVWDTMKSDDEGISDKMWMQLLRDSRKLYHLVDSLNVSMVVTYQLALYTTNQRWLDAGCLSNGKQIKEVFSEMIYCRPLWDDERPGEKYDCKPYKFKKEDKKIKEKIELDPDKRYMVCFVDKTRNDEDKVTLLYEWQGHFNKWTEKGFCSIVNDHRGV